MSDNLSTRRVDAIMEIVSDDTVDVSELFSRPRLVPRCQFFNLIAGESFDWKDDEEMDLAGVNGRATVWNHINLYAPKVFVLSPPCTLYSALVNMWGRKAMGEAKYQKRREEADRLLSFACEIGLHQLQCRQHFVFEHPDGASSWKTGPLLHLSQQPDVIATRFDQCRFGLRSSGSQQPIRKRTRLLHNVPQLCQAFGDAFCQCTVPHRRIEGSENGVQLSSLCETYPPLMVETMLAAIRAEVSVEFIN